MIKSIDDILRGNRPLKGVEKRLKQAMERAGSTVFGRELGVLLDGVKSQVKLTRGAYTLVDVFRDPQAFVDHGIAALSSKAVDKAYDFDMRHSLNRFAECLSEELGLSFIGAYVDTDVVRMSVESDRATGKQVPDRRAEFNEEFIQLTTPEILVEDGSSSLVLPFAYRGERIGAALFEKPRFSRRDVVSLIYCSAQFSRHLLNTKIGHAWRKDALTDYLTGLNNRRRFEHYCTRAIKQARKSGKPLSLLLIDLDHFKQINDEMGHEAGDKVLREVADVLRDNFREPDIARYGGEEFVVVLPETPYDLAHERARQFGIELHGIPGMKKISGTIGVTSTDRDVEYRGNEDDENAGELLGYLLKVADGRLYDAKTFRNAVCCVDTDSLTGLPTPATFKDDLRKHLYPGKRASGEVAIFLANVSGMSDIVRQYGHNVAWGLFRDYVVGLNGDASEFDSIARVHTRDEVIAFCCSDGNGSDFRDVVKAKSDSALKKLNSPKEGQLFNPLNFVLGVALYNPAGVDGAHAREIARNPNLLMSYAQDIVDELKDTPGKNLLIREYRA